MILIDSFGWIEFLADGPLASQYETYFADLSQIVTPTIVVYEVYKKVMREKREEEALVVVAQMKKTRMVPLTDELALSAADLSLKLELPLADSIVLATSYQEGSPVVTSDPHFENLDNVTFIR